MAKSKRARAVEPDVDLGALRAQAILDNARDAIISIDPDGIVTHFNLAAEKMFRYNADEVIGRNVSMLMPSPYHEEHDGYIARYRATGEAKAIGRIREVEARRRDGVLFPIELSVAEIETLGEPIYTAIIRDVTSFRELVDALQQERDFSDHLIDTAPILVLLFDVDARVLRFNRYMEELTGYSLEEVQGQDGLAMFVAPDEIDDVRRTFSTILGGSIVTGYFVTIMTKDGKRRTVSWSGTPLRDNDGSICGVLGAGEDVSDRILAEAELRRLEKLTREQERLADVGAIAARLVHDLGNPVSGLSMQAHLLSRRLEKAGGDPTLVQPCQRILSATARLSDLIRGFMDFAREHRLELEAIDAIAFLREIIELWLPVAAQSSIDIVLVPAPALGTIVGDAAKLRRVFDNLVRNAIEAIGEGPGTVEVSVKRASAGRMRFVVADDGPGVREDIDVFRLFETTKAQGTGIGLAVARQIVTAHDGTVEVGKRDPHGAVFTVDLPIVGPRA